MDATFFRRVSGNADPALIEPVARQAAEVGQSNLFHDDPPVSLEQHLGRIYFAMRNEETVETRRAYYDLVRLYQAELLKTTNWMIGRTGLLRKLIQAELKGGASVTILTFNHDLLVENALERLPRRQYPGAWCLQHAYGLDYHENISSRHDAFESECSGCQDKLVRVLKLHGSLNWVFRTRDPDPPGDLGRRKKKRKLFLWTNKRLPERPGSKLGY